MAAFCWQCIEDLLGMEGEGNDFEGLCKEGEIIIVLCEGCGDIWVDYKGRCTGGPECSRKHPSETPQGCVTLSYEKVE